MSAAKIILDTCIVSYLMKGGPLPLWLKRTRRTPKADFLLSLLSQ